MAKKEPEIYVLRNKKKKKVEVTGDYYIRQPSRASAGEIEHAAEKVCEAAGAKRIDEANDNEWVEVELVFYGVKLVRIENARTETKKDPWTNVSHWEGKGTGVCHVLYTVAQ